MKKWIIYETIYGHPKTLDQAHDTYIPGKFLLSHEW